MELTLLTEMGETYVVEIDPEMELENVMALIEAEVRYYRPLTFLSLFINWKALYRLTTPIYHVILTPDT
jgi:hypothetical protein